MTHDKRIQHNIRSVPHDKRIQHNIGRVPHDKRIQHNIGTVLHDKRIQHNVRSVPLTQGTDQRTKPFHINIRSSEKTVAAGNRGRATAAAEDGWNFYKRTEWVSTYSTQNNLQCSLMSTLDIQLYLSSFPEPLTTIISSIIKLKSTTLNLSFQPMMKQTVKNGKWLDRKMQNCSPDHMTPAKTNLQLHKNTNRSKYTKIYKTC